MVRIKPLYRKKPLSEDTLLFDHHVMYRVCTEELVQLFSIDNQYSGLQRAQIICACLFLYA